MKIFAINSLPTVKPVRQNYKSFDLYGKNIQEPIPSSQPSFKSNSGALKGMFIGALTGLGATALIIATGGLAGVVAAAGGAVGVLGGATGAGAQLGGIIGGLSSGDESGSTKDKNV